jgi:hypothetical protein
MLNNYAKSEEFGGRLKDTSTITHAPGDSAWRSTTKNKTYDEIVRPNGQVDSKHDEERLQQLRQLSQSPVSNGRQNNIYPETIIPKEAQNVGEENTKPYNTLFIDRSCASCSGFAP